MVERWQPSRALLLSNCHARRARRAHTRLASTLMAKLPTEILLADDALQSSQWLRAQQPGPQDLLAINGGDGTISEVLSALAAQSDLADWPVLALFPGGTTNMTANGVHRPLNRRRAERELSPRIDAGELRAMHVLAVSDGNTRRLGFCFGLGAVVNGVRFYRQQIAKLAGGGEWMSAWAMLRTAWGIARQDRRFLSAEPVELAMGDDRESRMLLALMTTTLDRMFLGIAPYWGMEAAPGHCTWIDAANSGFLTRLHRLVRRGGGLGEADGYFSRNVASLRVRSRLPWLLDGELYDHGSHLRELAIDVVGPVRALVLQ